MQSAPVCKQQWGALDLVWTVLYNCASENGSVQCIHAVAFDSTWLTRLPTCPWSAACWNFFFVPSISKPAFRELQSIYIYIYSTLSLMLLGHVTLCRSKLCHNDAINAPYTHACSANVCLLPPSNTNMWCDRILNVYSKFIEWYIWTVIIWKFAFNRVYTGLII
jgi:hypothetical protein